jgi:predicted metal-dependent phosphoesterase TrpH
MVIAPGSLTIEFINTPGSADQHNEFAFSGIILTMAIMLFDLHIHTALSPCSSLNISDIVDHAIECGLDGICITDHQTMDIRHLLAEGVQINGLCVLFGMEYSTPQGDFLLFGPFEDLAPDLEADSMLSTVRDLGGVAVAAHPFRKARPTDERLIRNGLCHGVECFNGRNTSGENDAVERWTRRYRLTRCGGSDAHTLDEMGIFATRFYAPVYSRTDLIRALSRGLCRPEIPAGQAPRSA